MLWISTAMETWTSRVHLQTIRSRGTRTPTATAGLARHVVTTDAAGAYSVYIDIDGDGKMDLASASHNKIAWYKGSCATCITYLYEKNWAAPRSNIPGHYTDGAYSVILQISITLRHGPRKRVL